MTFNKGHIPVLCIAWAFFLGLVGWTWIDLPTGLMIAGSVLLLVNGW